MSRAPSVATQLKNLRRVHAETERALNTAKIAAEAYRTRATKAEQEAAEWRRRFDALLAREPKP